MKLIPLNDVRGKIQAGRPLQFGVRDDQGKLLLNRGQMILDDSMLESLLARGAFVDADETSCAGRDSNAEEKSASFVQLWAALQVRLGSVLRAPQEALFLQKITECAQMLQVLGGRSPDQLIFEVVRHDRSRHASYGINHSLHVASLVCLVAQRSDWDTDTYHSALGAALTMNLSTVELQGQLASRGGRLSQAQEEAIKNHPTRSAEMLRAAGLTDERWLTAVEQHHEIPGGKGYPYGVTDPSELSQVLRYIDIFLAKHSGRADREPLPAQQAARDLFMSSNGHPVAALLIKEFGIFPPGCFVKLANGETGVVVRRGQSANSPIVAAIANRKGEPMPGLQRRDTSQADYAITSTVSDKSVLVKVNAERLFA